MGLEELIPNIKTAPTSVRVTSKVMGGLKPLISASKSVSITDKFLLIIETKMMKTFQSHTSFEFCIVESK
jgi:hypothetical protein